MTVECGITFRRKSSVLQMCEKAVMVAAKSLVKHASCMCFALRIKDETHEYQYQLHT